jgi:ferredoxin-NADP reductase
MHGEMIAAVVTRKFPLAQGYHAVELEARHRAALPAFDGGAIVDLIRDAERGVIRSQPLVPGDAFRLAVRSEPSNARFTLNEGDEIHVGAPRSTTVLRERAPRTILFSAGVGVMAIAGIAERLAASGQRFEVHNFARTPERAVLREQLDGLSARVTHRFGMSEDAIAHATAHAISPTHADSQIICSGPPRFMEWIERQALAWVHRSNIQKIVLGVQTLS